MALLEIKCKNVDLAPLRQQGLDALDVRAIAGLDDADLDSLKGEWHDLTHHAITLEADDLFRTDTPEGADLSRIPKYAALTWARIILHFSSTARTSILVIHPPDTIFIDLHSNLALVARFLFKNHLATGIQESNPPILDLVHAAQHSLVAGKDSALSPASQPAPGSIFPFALGTLQSVLLSLHSSLSTLVLMLSDPAPHSALFTFHYALMCFVLCLHSALFILHSAFI